MKNSFAILLVVLSATLAACSPSPSARVETFYQNLNKGQITEMFDMIDPAKLEQAGEDMKAKTRAGWSKTAEAIRARGGLTSVVVTSEEFGEIANYEATLKFGDGKSEIDKGKLQKINGKWYLAL